MKILLPLLFALALFFVVMASPVSRQSLALQNANSSGMPANLRSLARHRTVIILPIFTQAAYGEEGFYKFYSGRCSEKCLTVQIPERFVPSYVTGGGVGDVLLDRGLATVTDLDVDKNPSILDKYDKVILLHNEYVTKKEFDAIIHHPHVIYMYPNALYAEVKVDHDKHAITLVRGHGYPQKNIRNGFGWKFDNSKYEYDTGCSDWHFYKIKNGAMLDCYPQLVLQTDTRMLDKMAAL